MRGEDKLLRPLAGVPLLRLVVMRACATRHRVVVCLPPGDNARKMALRGTCAAITDVPDAETGMSASFRAFRAGLGKPTPALVLPADMPDLTTDDLLVVIAAFERNAELRLCRGTSMNGIPGHPIAFPAAIVERFAELRGDEGARRLTEQDWVAVPLPGRHALTDLDTPEDWREWEAQQNAQRASDRDQ